MAAPKRSHPSPPDVATVLLAHRRAFKAFLVSRVGSEADAEDLLQNGLIKALQHADKLNDGDKIVAWFYQSLRHAIIDHGRSRDAARRRDDAWATDTAALVTDDREAEKRICRCIDGLLPALKPAHAELIRRVELHGESVRSAAEALGLTATNASVTLHRARADLRRKLVDFCGSCTEDKCLDCDCGS